MCERGECNCAKMTRCFRIRLRFQSVENSSVSHVQSGWFSRQCQYNIARFYEAGRVGEIFDIVLRADRDT